MVQLGNQVLRQVPGLRELTVLCGSMETGERGPDQGNKMCRTRGDPGSGVTRTGRDIKLIRTDTTLDLSQKAEKRQDWGRDDR